MWVADDILVVVKVNEGMMRNRPVERGGAQRQDRAQERE
jgi:hypothetical protein